MPDWPAITPLHLQRGLKPIRHLFDDQHTTIIACDGKMTHAKQEIDS